MQENVVYQVAVTTEMATDVRLASHFKEQYENHQTSFWHPNKRNKNRPIKVHLESQRPKEVISL